MHNKRKETRQGSVPQKETTPIYYHLLPPVTMTAISFTIKNHLSAFVLSIIKVDQYYLQ